MEKEELRISNSILKNYKNLICEHIKENKIKNSEELHNLIYETVYHEISSITESSEKMRESVKTVLNKVNWDFVLNKSLKKL